MDTSSHDTFAVLGQSDPDPVELLRPDAAGAVVLTCEHGGRDVPASLAAHAPDVQDMGRHIAYDIGAREVAVALSESLSAPLVVQRYSRLVIDCNRPRHAADLAPAASDGTEIVFNRDLSQEALEARWRAIHAPFHGEVRAVLDRGAAQARPMAVVAVHSFAPRMNGSIRPWHVGLLARKDMRLAETLAQALRRRMPQAVVAFNQPYEIEDDSDYTIPVHGETRGIPHVLIEIRNDLIAEGVDSAPWIAALRVCIQDACDSLFERGDPQL
jgi:predicted N-formylglutamate amidohydrolase